MSKRAHIRTHKCNLRIVESKQLNNSTHVTRAAKKMNKKTYTNAYFFPSYGKQSATKWRANSSNFFSVLGVTNSTNEYDIDVGCWILNVERGWFSERFLDRTFVHLILLSSTNSALEILCGKCRWARMLKVSLLMELSFFVDVFFLFPSLLSVMMPFAVYVISPIYFSLCRLILLRTYAYMACVCACVCAVFLSLLVIDSVVSYFRASDDSLRKANEFVLLLYQLTLGYHFPTSKCPLEIKWTNKNIPEQHLLRTKKPPPHHPGTTKNKEQKMNHMLDALRAKAPMYKWIWAKILQKFVASLAQEMYTSGRAA